MFIGPFRLGETARGVANLNATPDATPTFMVHTLDGDNVASANGTCTVFDASNLDNSYRFSFTLDSNFSRGEKYLITVKYEVSAAPLQLGFMVHVS